jgi:rsbT co-antagonist protein RsbR
VSRAGAGNGAPTFAVADARLSRVIDALSYASVEDYELCQGLLRGDETDSFAELEAAFSLFIEELSAAKSSLVDALHEREQTNRELAMQLDTIAMQRSAMHELATPIIEVWAGVLCLPVVGIVDSQRSADMTERLLLKVIERQAELAIVDITGIDVMDTKTADHFVKMARAVALVGATCVVSGVNPNIARTLTHAGVDLRGVLTVRSLRAALELHLRGAAARERGDA